MKRITVVFLMVFISCNFVYAAQLNSMVSDVIENGWNLNESYATAEDNVINEASIKYCDSISACADVIAENKLYNEFKECYAEMDIYTKTLVNPVIDILKENRAEPVEYPGYGFADPDYDYRRGKEVSRTLLNTFWRQEKRILKKEQVNDLTIELKLLAEFTAGLNFEVLGTLNLNINGEIKECVKIRVTFEETVEISCVTKYQKTKVYNELLWKKKNTNNAWEKCGETYRIVEESTDEAVATDAPMPKY